MEGRNRMTLIRLVVVTVLAICMTCVVADRALAHITQFTINEDADLAPGGLQMAVTGTIVCTADETAGVSITISQDRGQQVAVATGGTGNLNCNGTVQEWGVTAITNSPFKKG